jgi:tRNA(Ile)-lysidine synthase
MAQFIKTIQNFSYQYNLWKEGSKIIVGVSGGGDSVCLLDILIRLKNKYNFELYIAHVNYGLRGVDSQADELFVRELAKKYNLPYSVLTVKKTVNQGNLEDNLRQIRYQYFEKLRLKMSYDVVAVAHNQDDQAETVLMRIIRGTGLNGLSAMKAKNGKIIRPLLQTSKKDILSYLSKHELQFKTDATNADTRFKRNEVRHNLIPYLEKNFNPTIKKTLASWAVTVADDYDFIEKKGTSFADLVCKNKSANFSAKEFSALHPAIARQALRSIISNIKSNLCDIENVHIEEMMKVIKSGKSKHAKATISGLNISKKGDKVDIRL